jgi:hypothetical protein
MLKRLILLGIIYTIFFSSFASQALAFSFVISNMSDEKVTLYLFWHDHELNYYGPVNLHTGEYEIKKVNVLNEDYGGHFYTLMATGDDWKFAADFEFEYEQPPKTIMITWDGCKATTEIK